MNWGKLRCTLTGKHKWDRSLDDMPKGSLFWRIDCTRCGYAIDGAPLRDFTPEQRRYLKLP